VVIGNPWNLDAGSIALQSTFVGRELYSATMGKSMIKLIEKHASVIEEDPNFNMKRIRACRYLHEFDREVQCASWGYPTEGAYYRDSSSTDSIHAVRVPLFAINSTDDPVCLLC
jgi:predicted alpha/beta-fold hydrolase